MAGESVLGSDALFASFPDNVAGQISAVDMRTFVLSIVPMIATIDEPLAYVAPMTNGVPTVMNPLLPNPIFEGNYWVLDGNQALIPNYPVGVGVPPGVEKLVEGVALFVATQQGGGTDRYFMQFRVGGVPINSPIPIDVDSSSERFYLSTEFPYDVATALPVDVQITPDGTNSDLDVFFSYIRLDGAMF